MDMYSRHELLVGDLCHEIDILKERLEEAEARAKYWSEKCAELQNESINHSKKMMANLLTAMLERTPNPKITHTHD